ncbi:nucleotidyltransferase family protein [Actinospongicola halichondriae]|uniref:nucleotidyltransferase family protein n=1 Tax=Actinospongicola halichondriae TaxID=3236844 RepID=UPI003D50B6D6
MTTAAARELADILAGRSGHIGDPAVGWPALLEVAAQHQLLSGLWSALHRQGVPALPPALAAAKRSPLAIVSARHARNAERIADLGAQLDRILDVLEVAGIDAIPFKGAHWLAAGLLPDPAAREMVDVDVLVPSSLADAAAEALARIGYRAEDAPADAEPTDHQLRPMSAPDRFGSVEVHVEPLVEFRRSLLQADELRDRARVQIVDGMSRRVPDPTIAMVLLLGHAQLQEDGGRLLELPLRALHDLHELGPAFRAEVDWDEVVERFRRVGLGGRIALAGFAVAAHEYFEIDLPVPTTGGRSWLRATEEAMDRPALAATYREAAYLPRALRAERMERLHGAGRGAPLWRARLAHVATGVGRRLRRGGR